MSDFWEKAKSAYQTAVGQTSKAIESGKLQIEINQLKSYNSSLFKEIGEYVAEKFEEDETIEELSLKGDMIRKKLSRIKKNHQKIETLQEQNKQLFGSQEEAEPANPEVKEANSSETQAQ